MKKDNCYCFSPYPEEHWGAMLALMGTSFFWLLDVTWTSTVRYVSTRHAAYYLLLTNHPIRLGDVREAGLKLGGARPCGKWRGHIALRLSEEHLPMVRQYIGQKLPLVEKCVEKDEATRL